MNETLKACTGLILNKSNKPTGKCLVKHDCKRYLLHLEFQKQVDNSISDIEFQGVPFKGLNHRNQSYQPVPYQAVDNGVCSFKK